MYLYQLLMACAHSLADEAVSHPSSGHVQVPIWPGVVPDALSNQNPDAQRTLGLVRGEVGAVRSAAVLLPPASVLRGPRG